ncbi:hypothetical protein [Paenibacillus radicis (ex Gao et al. 2016)]|uniref:Tail length tape measure protein n=1 Tax=Paenibacillus radicis (ex Gao et al. 2016) TaxID=1737354 RepID=A0A917HJM9_9BACL|nr:hypothetical protein [Paenibacillus radicis (ex Gao et al. 2016)]GGG81792.1 hypothetical protein GCM10010918_43840 [Paenibacillus radicis (ex Gao et al. 2016)]
MATNSAEAIKMSKALRAMAYAVNYTLQTLKTFEGQMNRNAKASDAFSNAQLKVIKSMNTTNNSMKRLETQAVKMETVGNVFDTIKFKISGANGELSKMKTAIGGNDKKVKTLLKSFDTGGKRIRSFVKVGEQISKITKAIQTSTTAQTKFNDVIKKGKDAAAKTKVGTAAKDAAEKTSEKEAGKAPPKSDGKGEEKDKKSGSASFAAGLKKMYGPIKKMLSMTFDGAIDQQKMKDQLMVTTDSAAQRSGVFEMVKQNALSSGQDVNKTFSGALSFMPLVSNTDQLDKLTQFSTRIAALSPTGEDPGASSTAMKSAMSGDFTDLSKQLQLPEKTVSDMLGNSKNMDSFLASFDKLLDKANMGEEKLTAMLKSPAVQLDMLKQQFKTSFADAGEGALAAISPLLTLLLDAFQSGKFQPFFDALNKGLTLGAELLASIGEKAMAFFDANKEFWPVILAFLPAVFVGLWALVAPVIAQALAWMAVNWPILLIMIAIGLLIAIFMQFGATAEQIVGFITGVFYALFAFIQNNVAYLWNALLAFAEFLFNIFVDPVYAIKKLFYDLVKNVGGFLGSIINAAIDGINALIDLSNKYLKTDFDTIGEFTMKAIDEMKPPTSNKDVLDLSSLRMEQVDIGEAFQKGDKAGKGFMAKTIDGVGDFKEKLNGQYPKDKAGAGAGPGLGVPAAGPDINRVGEVGKINDSVDITSEDLKTMRELAEMKNIQNFVTLQPSISVQTGDINNGYDIDTVIKRMEASLTNEIASSAEGVYA